MAAPCASWIHSNPTWPDVVDSTNGRDGTRFDRAFFLAVQDYIDKITGVYYSLPSPANIAEEIAVARGDVDCLNDRISGVIDPSGTLVVPPNVPTVSDIESLTGENYVLNDLLEPNVDGDAELPGFWSCDEAYTAAITYTNQFGVCQFTAGGSTAQIYQEIVPDADIAKIIALLTSAPGFTFGASVRAAGTTVRCFVTDGITTVYGPYHTGSDLYEWLACDPIGITGSSLRVKVGLEVAAGSTCYFTAPYCGIGPLPPAHWRPARTRQVYKNFTFAGTGTALGTYSGAQRFQFGGPVDGVLESLMVGASTAMPGAETATITLSRWNGASWDTVDTIVLGSSQQYVYKVAAPANHTLRTSMQPRGDPTTDPGRLFALDVATTGGPNWADDVFVETRWRGWERPLLGALAYGT